jgi:hypothetical protein
MEDDEILKELRAVLQAIVRRHSNDLTKIVAAMNARSTSTVSVDLKQVVRKIVEKVGGH